VKPEFCPQKIEVAVAYKSQPPTRLGSGTRTWNAKQAKVSIVYVNNYKSIETKKTSCKIICAQIRT